MFTTDFIGITLANRPTSIAGLGVSEGGAEPKARSMSLFALRAYPLILAAPGRSSGGCAGRPCASLRRRRLGDSAQHRAIQIPTTDPDRSWVMRA
jgi:hypothetical protein